MSYNRYSMFVQKNISALLFATLFSAIRRIGKPILPHAIETKEGNFTLLLGTHGIGRIGQEVVLHGGIGKVDAVFLESGSFPYFKEDTLEFQFPEKRFEEMAFYHKLIPMLKEKKIPILFGDIAFTRLNSLLLMGISSFITFGASFGGALLATSKVSPFHRAIGSFMSTWGLSTLVKRLITTEPKFIRKKENADIRKVAFYAELLHPENVIEILRNAAIAEKLLYYCERFYEINGRKPHIVIAMGSGHELITEYLKKGRDFCQKVLSVYPSFILKLLLGDSIKNYYPALAEVTYSGQNYKDKIFLDPTLET